MRPAVGFLAACCLLIRPVPAVAVEYEEARENIAAIVPGATREQEVIRLFGERFDEVEVEEPVTTQDREEFALFLRERLPAGTVPEYPLPTPRRGRSCIPSIPRLPGSSSC